MMNREALRELSEAYLRSPDRADSPKVRAMVRAEVDRIEREFDAMRRKVEIAFTPDDPYKSYEEMRDRVLSDRRMLVFTGFSDTPLWTPEINWKARAVHDWDHIQHGIDFSMGGEASAFRVSAARTPGLAPLYLSEIALQAAVQNFTGDFAPQKLVLPGARADRIARSLGFANTPATASAQIVWRAAGILRVSGMAGLMMHLKAQGYGQAAAVQIAAAAQILNSFDRRGARRR
jgi:hypothetical protein